MIANSGTLSVGRLPAHPCIHHGDDYLGMRLRFLH